MQQDYPLDVYSWVALSLFLLVIFFVVFPISIPIPFSKRFPVIPFIHSSRSQPIKIPFNLATTPFYAIIILLACRCIEFKVVVDGFVGSEGIQPYSIMILFYSLAYICVSLDLTGFVEFCAYWFSNKSGKNGKKLFTYFYILFNLMSAFTSNDVVVLTGTMYYTRLANIKPPTAFLISEFMAANIASMTLYIGNPTNVIVAQAYNISFIKYSAWMLGPTIVSIVVAYIFLRIVFRNPKFIPQNVDPPKRDPKSVLRDKNGAIFGIFLLVCCLVTLMATSFTSIRVWVVTLPFAVVSLLRDFVHDLLEKKKTDNEQKNKSEDKEVEKFESKKDTVIENVEGKRDTVESNKDTIVENVESNKDVVIENVESKKDTSIDVESKLKNKVELSDSKLDHQNSTTLTVLAIENISKSSQNLESSSGQEQVIVIDKGYSDFRKEETGSSCESLEIEIQEDPENVSESRCFSFKHTFPTIYMVFMRMPRSLLPFSFGMFILVEVLSSLGWISLFAKAFSTLTPSFIPAVFVTAVISIILCNLLNNLPMTVLLTRILQHPNFANADHVNESVMTGCLFALVIGSNVGQNPEGYEIAGWILAIFKMEPWGNAGGFLERVPRADI
ncbi:10884_t:CDS:2 [Acaulospora morrowiae]|uniref:10884_t:CDS:1 n=1 Tax=Acaulospora morrowiae TaxID=94023 RepID=A0A9N8YT86_9GLOM|nr:10884_t:CDS:2 [Acaulospora morrowiae]